VQLLGLFDVNIDITMEITVRKYVLHCSICLHADHVNQTTLVHRYHNYSTRELSGWLNVTSLNLGWRWKIPLPNDASANHRLRYN